jgi:hypothetical protein
MPPSLNLTCDQKKIPSYLHSQPTSPIVEIADDDRFYIRFNPQHVIGSDASDSGFSSENTSMNIRRLCRSAEDALYSNDRINEGGPYYHDWFVVEISKAQLDEFKYVNSETEKYYEFFVLHCPETCIYPHAESRIKENGVQTVIKYPKSLKVRIRKHYARWAQIVRIP